MVKAKKQTKKRVTRGRGDYDTPTRLGGALRALGGLGGRALGGLIGYGDAGSKVGNGLGAALSRWLGSGDYTVSANSIVNKLSPDGTVPAMHKNGQSIIVRHKEYLGPVMGSINFSVQSSYAINPGLGTTFPWLSAIASQYSEYTVKGMVYHYVPTSGVAVNGTNPALGTVMIQTSYRATESAPTSKIEMLNEYWCSESSPAEEFCHPIECDPKENPFNVQYVRTGSLPSSENQLMYDLGTTRVAVAGQQANGNQVGDLWVSYEIELRKPKLTNFGEDTQCMVATATTNITNANPMGSNITIVGNTTLGWIPSAQGATFTAGSAGRWLVMLTHRGAGFTGVTPAVTPLGSVSLLTQSVGVNLDAHVDSNGDTLIVIADITDNAAVGSITFSYASLTNATGARIIVTRVNSTFVP